MNLHKKLILAVMLLASVSAPAQQLMMEEQPDMAATVSRGPNLPWFFQTTFSLGTLIGSSSSARLPVNDLRSTDFTAGFKFKYKLSNVFSIWLEPKYHYASYNINQVSTKTITDSLFWRPYKIPHVKERFSTESVMLNGFFRINFDAKRGNFLGYYLDLGAGTDFYLGKEYVVVTNNSNGSQNRGSTTKIPYMSDFGYHAFARLGYDWVSVGFNYRMSSVFKNEYGFPEPPIYSVSIELSPYGH